MSSSEGPSEKAQEMEFGLPKKRLTGELHSSQNAARSRIKESRTIWRASAKKQTSITSGKNPKMDTEYLVLPSQRLFFYPRRPDLPEPAKSRSSCPLSPAQQITSSNFRVSRL
jgi:hypothetical protein